MRNEETDRVRKEGNEEGREGWGGRMELRTKFSWDQRKTDRGKKKEIKGQTEDGATDIFRLIVIH